MCLWGHSWEMGGEEDEENEEYEKDKAGEEDEENDKDEEDDDGASSPDLPAALVFPPELLGSHQVAVDRLQDNLETNNH